MGPIFVATCSNMFFLLFVYFEPISWHMNGNNRDYSDTIEKILSTRNNELEDIVYMPKALFYLFKTVPMPWQHRKFIEIKKYQNNIFAVDKYKLSHAQFRQRLRAGKSLLSLEQKDETVENSDGYSKYCNAAPLDRLRILFASEEAKYKESAIIRDHTRNRHTNISRTLSTYLRQNAGKTHPSVMGGICKLRAGKQPSVRKRRNKRVPFARKMKGRGSPAQSFKCEWVFAASIILYKYRSMLNKFILQRYMGLISISEDYKIHYERKLSTKEKKRCRLGETHRILADLLRIISLIVESVVKMKFHVISENDNFNNLNYILNNVGVLTGLYKHRYSIKKYVVRCKKISKQKRCWVFSWKIWVCAFGGLATRMERNLKALCRRIKYGRPGAEKQLSKQRIESNSDINTKQYLTAQDGFSKKFLHHFNESWRCWKAGLVYTSGVDAIDDIINKHLAAKIQEYKISSVSGKQSLNKISLKRLNAKKLRLWLHCENEKQIDSLNSTPHLSPQSMGPLQEVLCRLQEKKHDLNILRKTAPTLSCDLFQRHAKIAFPDVSSFKLYQKTMNSLAVKECKAVREFLKHANHKQRFQNMKDSICCKRMFQPFVLKSKALLNLCPVFIGDIEDKTVDSFLSCFLWEKAHQAGIIPDYFVSAGTSEIASVLKIADCLIMMGKRHFHAYKMDEISSSINLTLLSHVLKKYIDPIVADYLISRINTKVVYKDMEVINIVGVPRRIEFYDFIEMLLGVVFAAAHLPREQIVCAYKNEIFVAPGLVEGSIPKSVFLSNATRADYSMEEFVIDGFNISIGDKWTQNCFKTKISTNHSRFIAISPSTDAITKFKSDAQELCIKGSEEQFTRLVDKWNQLVCAYLFKFRETADTKSLVENEYKILNVIRAKIGTKMTARFPDVMFYGPRELGCLGMLSLRDAVKISSQKKVNINFKRFVIPWQSCSHGQSTKSNEHSSNNAHSSDKYIHPALERRFVGGFEFHRYNPLEIFGGIKRILQHTMWHSCGCPDTLNDKKYIFGVNDECSFSNSVFISWWSPALNTPENFLNERIVIEGTGIFLNGHISTLKGFFEHIFRNNLWEMIESSIITDLYQRCYDNFKIVTKKSLRQFLSSLEERKTAISVPQIYFEIAWSSTKEQNMFSTAKKISQKYSNIFTAIIMLDMRTGTSFVYRSRADRVFILSAYDINDLIRNNRMMLMLSERLRSYFFPTTATASYGLGALEKLEAICEVYKNEVYIFCPKTGKLIWTGLSAKKITPNKSIMNKNTKESGIVADIKKSHIKRLSLQILGLAMRHSISRIGIGAPYKEALELLDAKSGKLSVIEIQDCLHLNNFKKIITVGEQQFVYKNDKWEKQFRRIKLILRALKYGKIDALVAKSLYYYESLKDEESLLCQIECDLEIYNKL
ncbi:pre-mRNA-processing factor 8 [Enteropsectra breve]|nr:pre-mRNA-processing factor 8 [Enteropsectra breve]